MSNDQAGGLGPRILLDKIDKLRELGVSSKVPLPQIVAVGDQSSGKSSTLESLTGIPFPKGVTLCTRHATEIICRREEKKSITVSIQPAESSTQGHRDQVGCFRKTLDSLDAVAIGAVFHEAATAMGIKMKADDKSAGSAFSRDVLRIEKSGPDEEHLTIIDVPGIFENVSSGLATKDDIDFVKDMVKDYIRDSRTIILAVVPCTADVATQAIIRLALEVDPDGMRTLGVLTKPDLLSEDATKKTVVDLVRGHTRSLHLGYYAVMNRGADDTTSSIAARDQAEKELFSKPPWAQLDRSRLGIPALRSRLRLLLMDLVRSTFPDVKKGIMEELRLAKDQLDGMGLPRGDTYEQRTYLGRMAAKFVELKTFALDAYYSGDPVFSKRSDLKLITRVREMNEAFSKTFYKKAHSYDFELQHPVEVPTVLCVRAPREAVRVPSTASESSWLEPPEPDSPESELAPEKMSSGQHCFYDISFSLPTVEYRELDDIVCKCTTCFEPEHCGLFDKIEKLYLTSRGYELGTFGSHVVSTMFKEHSKKWEEMTLGHVSNAVLVVHHFIQALIEHVCPDVTVRRELWSSLLDDLRECYQRAMEHARFLLQVERNGPLVTCNPDFERSFNRARATRKSQRSPQGQVNPGKVQECWHENERHFDFAAADEEENVRNICITIHDVLKSYYEVARSRFVDNICAQAVDHFLLSGEGSPLRAFSPERVFGMQDDQLNMIAGETEDVRARREAVNRSISILEEARKVF